MGDGPGSVHTLAVVSQEDAMESLSAERQRKSDDTDVRFGRPWDWFVSVCVSVDEGVVGGSDCCWTTLTMIVDAGSRSPSVAQAFCWLVAGELFFSLAKLL